MIPDLIDATGTDDFSATLLRLLHESCGAEHCAIFGYSDNRLLSVGAASLDGTTTSLHQSTLYLDSGYWREDPTIPTARYLAGKSGTSLLKYDVDQLPNDRMRAQLYDWTNVCERMFLWGASEGVHVAVSILRSADSGRYTAGDAAAIGSIGRTLTSVLNLHSRMLASRPGPVDAISSLGEIEACIGDSLPYREAQVISRVLFGLSTRDIAEQLFIGTETATTYRKRAYERLVVKSQRELLLWYLVRWAEWRDAPRPSTRGPAADPAALSPDQTRWFHLNDDADMGIGMDATSQGLDGSGLGLASGGRDRGSKGQPAPDPLASWWSSVAPTAQISCN